MRLIEPVAHPTRLIVEIWDGPTEDWHFKEPFHETFYDEVNDWCLDNLGYRARASYNRFEFEHKKDLTMFMLRWS